MSDKPGFEDSVSSELAANYKRLWKDVRVTATVAALKRHGVSSGAIEILLRNFSTLPKDWHSEHETWKRVEQRRAGLTKKLLLLAKEIDDDPDLGGICYGIHTTTYNTPADQRGDMRSLSQLLGDAASWLEPCEQAIIEPGTGPLLTGREFERNSRPTRMEPLKTFVLRSIFERLKPHYKRAPNIETEIIASVLLQTPIKPGTVTQLRRKERRPYARG